MICFSSFVFQNRCMDTENKEVFYVYILQSLNTKAKTPAAFGKAYPDAKFSIINKDNYLDWITDKNLT